MYREFKSLGSKVIETNQPLPGPEDEKDFWEGEKFDVSDQTGCHQYLLPDLSNLYIRLEMLDWYIKLD